MYDYYKTLEVLKKYKRIPVTRCNERFIIKTYKYPPSRRNFLSDSNRISQIMELLTKHNGPSSPGTVC